MGGRTARQKGSRVEREIVKAHNDAGILAKRVDNKAGQLGQEQSWDIDVYHKGAVNFPLIGEVKARKNGAGFKTIEDWLANNDFLVLKRNHAEPIIVVPWRVWIDILGQADEGNENP